MDNLNLANTIYMIYQNHCDTACDTWYIIISMMIMMMIMKHKKSGLSPNSNGTHLIMNLNVAY